MADAAAANPPPADQPRARPDPLVNIQDRLFHTLFFRLTLAYARTCPRSVRRLVETMILMKAVLCFFMLVYIHLVFARRPVQCLGHVKETWPRDGILRVEVIRDFQEDPNVPYTVDDSYEKERRIQVRNQQQTDDFSSIFSVFSTEG